MASVSFAIQALDEFDSAHWDLPLQCAQHDRHGGIVSDDFDRITEGGAHRRHQMMRRTIRQRVQLFFDDEVKWNLTS